MRFLILTLLSLWLLAGCGGRVYVPAPPPAPIVETRPAPPATGLHAVWVEGHWKYNGRRYVWVKGRWVKGREHGVWVKGHWEKRPRGWVWLPGHWK